jgi:hypothetical protein
MNKVILAFLALSISCISSAAPPATSSPTQSTPTQSISRAYEKAVAMNDANLITELVFNSGKSDLSQDARSQLGDILYSAQSKGKIAEVKIISWADKEYPADKSKLDKNARKLADDRIHEIRNYIEDKAQGVEVNAYNMAEQPDAIEKLLNSSSNAKVKKSLESVGLIQPEKTNMPKKASRALVMVSVQ